jgi:hypothetical protein
MSDPILALLLLPLAVAGLECHWLHLWHPSVSRLLLLAMWQVLCLLQSIPVLLH